MFTLSYLTVFAAASFSYVCAWGATGHQLAGAIAQQLINSDTYDTVKGLLAKDFNGNMSASATWADVVKRKDGYRWSSPLHFTDIQDNPSKSCLPYDGKRDCANGMCLVGAIANYTSRLACSYSEDQRAEALKFIIHFVGDLTQPLHNCARLVGGNDVKIGKFDNRHTLNLHEIWDTTMIAKRIKNDYSNSAPKYLDYLLNQASTAYQDQQADWTSCLTTAKFATTMAKSKGKTHSGSTGGKTNGGSKGGPPVIDTPAAECAVAWATDSDGINCQTVWNAYDNDPSQDFGADYYQTNIPVIEQQLVKAGVRMARLLETVIQPC
jgi:hypothetical protein